MNEMLQRPPASQALRLHPDVMRWHAIQSISQELLDLPVTKLEFLQPLCRRTRPHPSSARFFLELEDIMLAILDLDKHEREHLQDNIIAKIITGESRRNSLNKFDMDTPCTALEAFITQPPVTDATLVWFEKSFDGTYNHGTTDRLSIPGGIRLRHVIEMRDLNNGEIQIPTDCLQVWLPGYVSLPSGVASMLHRTGTFTPSPAERVISEAGGLAERMLGYMAAEALVQLQKVNHGLRDRVRTEIARRCFAKPTHS